MFPKISFFEFLNLMVGYALAIWLGTSAFYMGTDAIQGAASGGSVHQVN